MAELSNTQFFKIQQEPAIEVSDILEPTISFSLHDDKEKEIKQTLTIIYDALRQKGYNPINQIVGYIMSGDPTYITSHRNARSLIMKAERDELVEEMLKYYIEKKGL